ncbi:MAG: CapA family protein [Oscillospiraceae bacterium]|jgi:poly-gamma-glutamate synthesis protein (capsule biosynthesis protein)|nr:CapA family protein [Oscillospiraceae bacterium]
MRTKAWWLIPLLMGALLCCVAAQAEIILGDRDYVMPTPTPYLPPEPTPDPWPKTIVITVGGDCTLGSTDTLRASETGFDAVIAEKGYDWPFSQLLPVFAADDLTLVNFEGALTESRDRVEKSFNFKGPADYARMLTLGSVEAVTLANNHALDYGEAGRADTMAALDAAGITYCAPNAPAVYEVRGVKIGLIGHTFPYKDGKRDISADVDSLRAAGCQIIIASFHWGSEYEFAFNRDQRTIGRAAIRSGADVVVGHHPHVIQGIERFEESYILYSLGNLVFGGNRDPQERDTYVAQLTFTVYEDGRAEGPALKILPARLTERKSGTDYRPIFAEGDEAERILKAILRRSYQMEDFVNPN